MEGAAEVVEFTAATSGPATLAASTHGLPSSPVAARRRTTTTSSAPDLRRMSLVVHDIVQLHANEQGQHTTRHEGWLKKQSQPRAAAGSMRRHPWRRRYFVLQVGRLEALACSPRAVHVSPAQDCVLKYYHKRPLDGENAGTLLGWA
jgi:hypothetical protein